MKIKTVLISLLFAPSLVFAQDKAILPNPGLTPESNFYFLDKLGEALRDFLTFSPEAKARLQVAYAAERVAEIKIILETKGVEAKGLKVAQARLEANTAKATDIVEQEKQKGRDVSKLAGEIVDSFHIQRKAAKQAFDNAKQEFFTKKGELHNQLLAAIETGDTALQEQIRAQLIKIEAEKDEVEAKKDAIIAVLETEKDRLQDELEEEKHQEDEERDAAEEAEDSKKEAEEQKLEQEERVKEMQIEAAERANERAKEEIERAQEKQREAEEKSRESEERGSELD